MIRVALPYHLRRLARIESEVILELAGSPSLAVVLDELERIYPVLRGTIREHGTLRRRPFIRFFVCREDWSNASPEIPLPESVCRGEESILVVGAMAGG